MRLSSEKYRLQDGARTCFSSFCQPLEEATSGKSLISTAKFVLEKPVTKAFPGVNLVTSVHTRVIRVELI